MVNWKLKLTNLLLKMQLTTLMKHTYGVSMKWSDYSYHRNLDFTPEHSKCRLFKACLIRLYNSVGVKLDHSPYQLLPNIELGYILGIPPEDTVEYVSNFITLIMEDPRLLTLILKFRCIEPDIELIHGLNLCTNDLLDYMKETCELYSKEIESTLSKLVSVKVGLIQY